MYIKGLRLIFCIIVVIKAKKKTLSSHSTSTVSASKGLNQIVYTNYSMNQLMLDIPTAYEPEENHPAYQINQLVESLDFTGEYTTGRYPYHPCLLLKLVLFAYARGI